MAETIIVSVIWGTFFIFWRLIELSVFKLQGGKGKNKIRLSESDKELLKIIGTFKYLSLYQLEYYFERLYRIKRSSLRVKLYRWREKDIVVSREYTKRPAPQVYYRLGPEGVYLLKCLGFYPQNSDVFIEDLTIKSKYDHLFAIRDVALLSMIELKSSQNFTGVKSLPPTQHPYFRKGLEGTSPFVVPDWIIFSNMFGYLDIEMDTGTENHSRIIDKFRNYTVYANEKPEETHHVLISIIDSADAERKYVNRNIAKDRSGRVANLKEVVINTNAHVCPNLNPFVVSISNVARVAYKLLTGIYPASAERRSNEIEAAIRLLICYPAFNGDYERLDAYDFYLPEVDTALYADGHFLIKKANGQKEVILMKLMDEGSIKSFDQIDYLNRLKAEGRFKRKVDKIIAVYRHNDELENDVIGRVLPNIYFTSIDQLGIDIGNAPPLYKTINTVRKEVVSLNDGGN